MTQSAITAQVHEALDAHGNLTAQITLGGELAHFGTQAFEFVVRQILDFLVVSHTGRVTDIAGAGTW